MAEKGDGEVKDFAEFYFDTFENHLETFSYHLSDNATLDWFGQTVKGSKNIGIFLKNNASNIRHDFPKLEPCDKIGYRDTHVVKLPERKALVCPPAAAAAATTPLTPSEQGQGDGLHNSEDTSPAKRTCLAGDIVEDAPPMEVRNVTSTGSVEFRRRSSKKFQKETKWSRPCKLHLAYSRTQFGYVVHLVIYEGNVRCRRNLMKDFEKADDDGE